MTKNYKFELQENMYDCGIAALKTKSFYNMERK